MSKNKGFEIFQEENKGYQKLNWFSKIYSNQVSGVKKDRPLRSTLFTKKNFGKILIRNFFAEVLHIYGEIFFLKFFLTENFSAHVFGY